MAERWAGLTEFPSQEGMADFRGQRKFGREEVFLVISRRFRTISQNGCLLGRGRQSANGSTVLSREGACWNWADLGVNSAWPLAGCPLRSWLTFLCSVVEVLLLVAGAERGSEKRMRVVLVESTWLSFGAACDQRGSVEPAVPTGEVTVSFPSLSGGMENQRGHVWPKFTILVFEMGPDSPTASGGRGCLSGPEVRRAVSMGRRAWGLGVRTGSLAEGALGIPLPLSCLWLGWGPICVGH